MNDFHVQIKRKGKRKVVVKIYDNETHKILACGEACCHKDDEYDYNIGESLARQRAVLNYYKNQPMNKNVNIFISYETDCTKNSIINILTQVDDKRVDDTFRYNKILSRDELGKELGIALWKIIEDYDYIMGNNKIQDLEKSLNQYIDRLYEK